MRWYGALLAVCLMIRWQGRWRYYRAGKSGLRAGHRCRGGF